MEVRGQGGVDRPTFIAASILVRQGHNASQFKRAIMLCTFYGRKAA